jgi:hypothetical protein
VVLARNPLATLRGRELATTGQCSISGLDKLFLRRQEVTEFRGSLGASTDFLSHELKSTNINELRLLQWPYSFSQSMRKVFLFKVPCVVISPVAYPGRPIERHFAKLDEYVPALLSA